MNVSVAQPLLKIGEVAQRSGLPVKTIRYYEEIGLLAPTVERSQSGYRLFNQHILQRLVFIKRAQSLGLTLHEIKDVLQVHDGGHLPCHAVKKRLQDKLDAITSQIRTLESQQAELQQLLSGWQEFQPDNQVVETICPNIQSHSQFRAPWEDG